jgi:hypothetical protein
LSIELVSLSSSDSIFAAIGEISYNSKLISNYEKTIRSCEEELVALRQVMETQSSGWFSTSYDGSLRSRAHYIASKINTVQKKIEALENANREFKLILAKGDKR